MVKPGELKGLILDLDQTLVDSSIAEPYRGKDWNHAIELIPEFRVFPNMPDVFDCIRALEIPVCIVSSSSRNYIEAVIDFFGIPCDYIVDYKAVCDNKHGEQYTKPDPIPMRLALQYLNAGANEVISIGDSEDDRLSSVNAGIDSFYFCTWGKSNSTYPTNNVLKSPSDMKSLIEKNFVQTIASSFDEEQFASCVMSNYGPCYCLYKYYIFNRSDEAPNLSQKAKAFSNWIVKFKDNYSLDSSGFIAQQIVKVVNHIVVESGQIDFNKIVFLCAPRSSNSKPHVMRSCIRDIVDIISLDNNRSWHDVPVVDAGMAIQRKYTVEAEHKSSEKRTLERSVSSMYLDKEIFSADDESLYFILDEILTTGSTVEACTKLLEEAGVDRSHIFKICIARTTHRYDKKNLGVVDSIRSFTTREKNGYEIALKGFNEKITFFLKTYINRYIRIGTHVDISGQLQFYDNSIGMLANNVCIPTSIKLEDYGAISTLSNFSIQRPVMFVATYTGMINQAKFVGLKQTKVRDELLGILCVAENILIRSTQTDPSHYLCEYFGIDPRRRKNDPDYYERFRKAKAALSISAKESLDRILYYELLLIELIKTGQLSLETTQWLISHTEKVDWKELEAAAHDVCLWLNALTTLIDHPFSSPKIISCGIDECDTHIDIAEGKAISQSEDAKGITILYSKDVPETDAFHFSYAAPITYPMEFVSPAKEDALRFILKNLFSYADFRNGQIGIIERALTRKTTIGILPTGSGKSLCYQMAAMLQPCPTFVVCPIISLIQDQKRNMDLIGIDRSFAIHSGVDGGLRNRALEDFSAYRLQFIWVSPERFLVPDFLESLDRVSFFGYAVIDEVHCLSEWGHDFRTSYLMLISNIRKHCNNISLLGLTATASTHVQQDIKAEFGTNDEAFVAAFTPRKELRFHVIKSSPNTRLTDLRNVLGDVQNRIHDDLFAERGSRTPCGIIFTITKSERNPLGCESLIQTLRGWYPGHARRMDVYHSADDRDDNRRDIAQQHFMDNDISMLIATKAFGMGVNKPNVRYSIHYGMPWSIESFYQEAGRAGRDQQPSDCYIIYDDASSAQIRTSLEKLFSPATDPAEVAKLLEVKPYKLPFGQDISSIFFLWKQNNKGIQNEIDNIIAMTSRLYTIQKFCKENHQTPTYIITASDWPGTRPEAEKALYRLHTLNLIGSWLILNWSSAWQIEVDDVYDLSVPFDTLEKHLKASLTAYIQRTDAKFQLDRFDEDNKAYYDIVVHPAEAEKKPIRKYAHCLALWVNDNIIYSRKTSIQNMLNMLQDFRNEEDFKKRVEDYFVVSTKNIKPAERVSAMYDPEAWVAAIHVDDISLERTRVSREIIDTRNDPRLDFAFAMLHLMSGMHDSFGVKDRLASSLRASERNHFADRIKSEIITVAKGLSDQARDVIGDVFVDVWPDEAETIQKALQDRSSWAFITEKKIKNQVAEIRAFLEQEALSIPIGKGLANTSKKNDRSKRKKA